MMKILPRIASPRIAVIAALAGLTLLPATSAHAGWRGGVFIGLPPIVVGPPVVAYPPPYYYAPGYYYGPAYYPYPPAPAQQSGTQAPAQPQMSQANTPFGSTCYAGFYTCPAAPQQHVGAVCSCPGIGAPSYGSVR
jgi:hypothetical protein